jgi:ankyrin repeat protein
MILLVTLLLGFFPSIVWLHGSTMSWEVSADEWEAFQALETGSPLREWLGDAVYYSGLPRSHAMHIACEAGRLDACEFLIQFRGASVRQPDNNGETPMYMACLGGHLPVCRWLFGVGAAADITKPNNDGVTPMAVAAGGGSGAAPVCHWLFSVLNNSAAAAAVRRRDEYGSTPMMHAATGGNFELCKWLYEAGAAADITTARHDGFTLMHRACLNGDLAACEWLYEAGAAADISKADEKGETPMYMACEGGHLPVCKWLYEVGAAADITKTNNDGDGVLFAAIEDRGDFDICTWLVLNGALNRPDPAGHVDEGAAKHETRQDALWRWYLREWAQEAVAVHGSFFHVVLRASVLLPESQQQASPEQRCRLPRLPRVVLERVMGLLGVEVGRRLRNARELAVALGDPDPARLPGHSTPPP